MMRASTLKIIDCLNIPDEKTKMFASTKAITYNQLYRERYKLRHSLNTSLVLEWFREHPLGAFSTYYKHDAESKGDFLHSIENCNYTARTRFYNKHCAYCGYYVCNECIVNAGLYSLVDSEILKRSNAVKNVLAGAVTPPCCPACRRFLNRVFLAKQALNYVTTIPYTANLNYAPFSYEQIDYPELTDENLKRSFFDLGTTTAFATRIKTRMIGEGSSGKDYYVESNSKKLVMVDI